jgi:hypothetical protein
LLLKRVNVSLEQKKVRYMHKWTDMQVNVMANVNKQITSETNGDTDSYCTVCALK